MNKAEPEIVLPGQETFFSTEKLRRSARAGTNLPEPTMAPYGYDPQGAVQSPISGAGAGSAVPAGPPAPGRSRELRVFLRLPVLIVVRPPLVQIPKSVQWTSRVPVGRSETQWYPGRLSKSRGNKSPVGSPLFPNSNPG